ncbi:hypothetical protein [Aureliella helgolandensis]|uniref:Uncharacterized protein n=1 Tax=Aureliella helgolandensis TaxID=2527968 RepID=A0A518GDI0_9BACT|nr:hypothetical protein [Aureliella helgolandensis]QDV26665.1 hypothetical protein Q31a_50410 [Aureliella helgolandensis]
MLLIDNIPIEVRTQAGLHEFVRCFREVWGRLPEDDRFAIATNLKAVEWRDMPIDTTPYTLAITKRIDITQSRIEFDSIHFTGGPDCNYLNTIAHELRHAWQFATNFEASQALTIMAKRLCWEVDATDYALEYGGPESNFSELRAGTLPTDAGFDELANLWPCLTGEQRQEVLATVRGITAEAKQAAIAS